MQFVLLIYQGTTPLPNSESWATLSDDEQKAIYADYSALNSTPGVSPGLPLGLPGDATTVQVADGQRVTRPGTFNEEQRAVGGYMTLEAEDLDAALDIAARIPAARHGGAIEVRPAEVYWK